MQYTLVLESTKIKYPSLVAGGTGPDPKITEAWTPRAVLDVGYLVPNTQVGQEVKMYISIFGMDAVCP